MVGALLRLILALCALFASGAAFAQTLSGWDKVEAAIASTNANQITDLNGRSFPLTLIGGNGKELTVEPAAAFKISGDSSGYTLTIVNASELIDAKPGNILLKKSISWRAVFVAVNNFDIEIQGVSNCAYTLAFSQKGGNTLNLNELKNIYQIDWQFSNATAVLSSDITDGRLVVQRAIGNQTPLTVVLNLRQEGSSYISTKPVTIPSCGNYLVESGSQRAVLIPRTPAQCIVPTSSGSRSNAKNSQGEKVIELYPSFTNTCDAPIRCSFKWRLSDFGTESDWRNEVNGEEIDSWSATRTLYPSQELKFDFDLVGKDARRFFSWSNLLIPDHALPDYRDSDFVCVWA